MNLSPNWTPSDTNTCGLCIDARCAVIMTSDPYAYDLSKSTMYENMNYAAKYGYDFLVFRCPPRSLTRHEWMWNMQNHVRSLQWYIPIVLRAQIKDYDYLLYLGERSNVADASISIPNAWQMFRTSPDNFIVALNTTGSIPPVIIVYNDPSNIASRLLEDWSNSPLTPFCRNGEQDVIFVEQCLNNIYNYTKNGQRTLSNIVTMYPFARVNAGVANGLIEFYAESTKHPLSWILGAWVVLAAIVCGMICFLKINI